VFLKNELRQDLVFKELRPAVLDGLEDPAGGAVRDLSGAEGGEDGLSVGLERFEVGGWSESRGGKSARRR
jgi:hypothetical protein